MAKQYIKITEVALASKGKIGRVNLNGAHLELHEYETILFLNLYGYDIDVIKPSNIPKMKNPDFYIRGTVWETKSPEGSGNSTIARHLHKAGRQADHLILDLRRVKITAEKAEHEAVKCFEASTRIRHMLLITKDARLLDIVK